MFDKRPTFRGNANLHIHPMVLNHDLTLHPIPMREEASFELEHIDKGIQLQAQTYRNSNCQMDLGIFFFFDKFQNFIMTAAESCKTAFHETQIQNSNTDHLPRLT